MSRIAATAVIVLLLLNGMSTAMAASGLSEDIGVELNPGAEKTMDKIVKNAKDGFDPSANIVESFVGVSLAALNTGKLVIQGMTTAAPVMFLNLGFPEWFVVPMFAPMYILVMFYFIYIVTGTRPI
ncbi:hypothetical protein [Halobacterium hubeiense]|uniref:hypothetical protein n=1 Tax=Halobacterium hubeiense TaxID=1407499 RepID=UPI003C71DF5B